VKRARLSLYSRSYCHLCQEMLTALESLRGEFAFDIEVVDIDADAVLAEKYNDWVPVLAAGDNDLCHYFLDEPKVREYLTHFR
jgi:thioredoxin reductase (NADPH)